MQVRSESLLGLMGVNPLPMASSMDLELFAD